MKIDMSYGSGGKSTGELVLNIFAKHFGNEILGKMEDAAIIEANGKLAFTTDSFVVTPPFFNGGDIGKLAVCGTVNDLLMMGAVPKYLSIGFIIETGVDIDDLEKIAISIGNTVNEANVKIVAGDTKVIEGNGGIYINTSGIGEIPKDRNISAYLCEADDVIILSGNLGDHHSCILSSRLNIKNNIKSDCAPLNSAVDALFIAGVRVKAMRDVTRGGLATILNEIADSSKLSAQIEEISLPIDPEVKAFCGILGLDPLYMGNEGKFIAVVDKNDVQKAIEAIKSSQYGKNATIIGKITKGNGVTLITRLGGKRKIDVLYGEGLPRIC
jgi:hydrogenase expression/formation protein HypE